MSDEARMEPSWPLIGMTTAEAARSLRCDEKTVQEAIKTGGLPARLVGRGWRISPKALEEWIASGKGEGRRPPQTVDVGGLDDATVAEVRRLASEGVSKAQIARQFGLSRPMVYKCLRVDKAPSLRGASTLHAEADVVVDAEGRVIKDRDGDARERLFPEVSGDGDGKTA